MSELPQFVDIQQIFELLPHRYPFLMVDRVTEVVPGESLKAFKNVTVNEPFFQGHFPGLPVMPGVLMCEALAQAGGLLALLSDEEMSKGDNVFLFTGIDKVRFRRRVVPGDKLDLEVFDMKRKMNLIKMSGKALVNGELACQGIMSAAIVNREDM
ncbi:3-hydroxyacyl-ACP dehydratase FabZ [Desulfovibrio ferrophilus]|uniref:3-hydroxyacyl-[acyl-carrier-protein] dehydratase FabZ n=1 Tax=Desulfovibrio ferrophilus TaxID=241368 RepID=A0A2Z6AV12_9BACT|nr:3-hydroxyacyl-ACP dehydratase FabZ [Desulfovibrio ferrophilus]BBD07058.1 3-hydroxyacyl-ACP dehydratase [Desulfovibrio ferrophilus]